jgi:hypothetical protein
MKSERTLRALSCVFGFLLPMRFFKERMASFGATVFDRMTSEISRLSAISSLLGTSSANTIHLTTTSLLTYKLLLVALSICSSRAVLAEDDHQLMLGETALGGDQAAQETPKQQGSDQEEAKLSGDTI